MTTEIPKLNTLYDFSEITDAVPPPPPPDLGVPKEPKSRPAPAPEEPALAQTDNQIDVIDLMRASKFTIAIQLLPHDGNPAGRLCTIGVQLDKQAPSITAIRGEDFGVMPSPIWELMEAQAQLAATKPAAGKKQAEVPPPMTTKSKPASAPVKAAQPAPTASVAAAAPQDDIYSLFDL